MTDKAHQQNSKDNIIVEEKQDANIAVDLPPVRKIDLQNYFDVSNGEENRETLKYFIQDGERKLFIVQFENFFQDENRTEIANEVFYKLIVFLDKLQVGDSSECYKYLNFAYYCISQGNFEFITKLEKKLSEIDLTKTTTLSQIKPLFIEESLNYTEKEISSNEFDITYFLGKWRQEFANPDEYFEEGHLVKGQPTTMRDDNEISKQIAPFIAQKLEYQGIGGALYTDNNIARRSTLRIIKQQNSPIPSILIHANMAFKHFSIAHTLAAPFQPIGEKNLPIEGKQPYKEISEDALSCTATIDLVNNKREMHKLTGNLSLVSTINNFSVDATVKTERALNVNDIATLFPHITFTDLTSEQNEQACELLRQALLLAQDDVVTLSKDYINLVFACITEKRHAALNTLFSVLKEEQKHLKQPITNISAFLDSPGRGPLKIWLFHGKKQLDKKSEYSLFKDPKYDIYTPLSYFDYQQPSFLWPTRVPDTTPVDFKETADSQRDIAKKINSIERLNIERKANIQSVKIGFNDPASLKPNVKIESLSYVNRIRSSDKDPLQEEFIPINVLATKTVAILPTEKNDVPERSVEFIGSASEAARKLGEKELAFDAEYEAHQAQNKKNPQAGGEWLSEPINQAQTNEIKREKLQLVDHLEQSILVEKLTATYEIALRNQLGTQMQSLKKAGSSFFLATGEAKDNKDEKTQAYKRIQKAYTAEIKAKVQAMREQLTQYVQELPQHENGSFEFMYQKVEKEVKGKLTVEYKYNEKTAAETIAHVENTFIKPKLAISNETKAIIEEQRAVLSKHKNPIFDALRFIPRFYIALGLTALQTPFRGKGETFGQALEKRCMALLSTNSEKALDKSIQALNKGPVQQTLFANTNILKKKHEQITQKDVKDQNVKDFVENIRKPTPPAA